MMLNTVRKRPLDKRVHPRIGVEAFCTAVGEAPGLHAVAVDLSPHGLRIQRNLDGKMPRKLQLEVEIPEVDELLWAVGEVRYDKIHQTSPDPTRGLSGVIRSCGIRLVALADYHQRLIREYVMDTSREVERTQGLGHAWGLGSLKRQPLG